MEVTIFTIGHSTRSIKEFIEILKKYDITYVIDIRKIPKSRTNPQFDIETLQNSLNDVNIKYEHSEGLGGLRRTTKKSINLGWRNQSFRGYADYIQTKDFDASLEKLIELANKEKIVLMCAESLPWRCHRTLIADALTIRNINVEHIFTDTSAKKHKITPWAKIDGLKITYPVQKLELVNPDNIIVKQ